jgi:hypothetical protein
MMAANAKGAAMDKTNPETSTRPPVDTAAVLSELLSECRQALGDCFAITRDPEYGNYRLDAMTVASRLIKSAISLSQALDRKPTESTHRIVVERPEPSPAVQVKSDGGELPHENLSKTIHGGMDVAGPQD